MCMAVVFSNTTTHSANNRRAPHNCISQAVCLDYPNRYSAHVELRALVAGLLQGALKPGYPLDVEG